MIASHLLYRNTWLKLDKKQEAIRSIVRRVPRSVKVPDDIIELIIFHMLHFEMSIEAAEKCFNKLKRSFVDWNEFRVSSVWEIERYLESAREALPLAKQLQELLIRVHKDRSVLSLEFLVELPKAGFRKYFKGLDFIDRSTIELILRTRRSEPLVPLDRDSELVLVRMGIASSKHNIIQKQKALQQLIPEEDVIRFHLSVLNLAHSCCPKKEEELKCKECPVRMNCASGQKKSK